MKFPSRIPPASVILSLLALALLFHFLGCKENPVEATAHGWFEIKVSYRHWTPQTIYVTTEPLTSRVRPDSIKVINHSDRDTTYVTSDLYVDSKMTVSATFSFPPGYTDRFTNLSLSALVFFH